jgi:hypothetical protein
VNKQKLKHLTLLLLPTVFLVIGCQSNPDTSGSTSSTDATVASATDTKTVNSSQPTLPEKMRGTWRDGGQNGGVAARRIKQTGANTYAGEMTFNGTYEGCQRFEPFTAVLAPGGDMTLTHPCIDTASLTYDASKGWSGRVSWGEIRNLR